VRLKSLEIKGFKSFADKTIINFDDNITGIVGPNGCGKSNIVDSIRWVIGEQKISHLRSENLDSLVFNGSKTRSASGLAEVSLTFENTRNLLPTDFSTVTITRKFYKSGESEYRLNDVQCRLKDIQNLFMDTGVSTDSYAIIALDMVDDLIKDKDNSRRKMLEQAAGITIYKTRKKEAKNKLDATEQDLSRIEDLLFEINNQLKTLENQAKKAEKYFEIKKDYKETAIELAIASLEGFNLTYKELTEQQETESDKKIQLEAQIAVEEAALEQERVNFIEKERGLQSQQQEFNDLVQKLRTKENDKNLAAQRLDYLNDKEKGLSFKNLNANLDMRYDPENDSKAKASDILNNTSELELMEIFSRYAEEKNYEAIAKNIIKYREDKKFEKVSDFLNVIDKTYEGKDLYYEEDENRQSTDKNLLNTSDFDSGTQLVTYNHKSRYNIYTRLFQALRIVVNYELTNVQRFLNRCFFNLEVGGILAVITFHSAEDKIVKKLLLEIEKLKLASGNN